MDPGCLHTVNDIFFIAVERQRDCVQSYKHGDRWQSISSAQLYANVLGVSQALTSWGMRRGERIAILSENRPEWAVADFACLGLGIIDVPVYPTLTAEQAAFILRDCGARVIFLSTIEQLKKIQSIRQQTALEKIVVMDRAGADDVISMHQFMPSAPRQRDSVFDESAHASSPEDLATIIYTSGTTGTPKGAMLTHRNLASDVVHAIYRFGLNIADRFVSVLPLSHITARHVDYAMFFHGVPIAYCSNIDHLAGALREVRPTFFAGVPRIYEKVRQKAESHAAHGLKRAVFEWAMRVGSRHLPEIAAERRPSSLPWKLADKLVFSKIKAGFGGALEAPVSGGAPLGRELAEWYASIGMPIYEGYGLTETSPVIAVNAPGAFRIGSVGKPLDNIECRIAEDGELLVRGEIVFKGYWNMPQETQAALSPDGWFHTGDIGSIDSDGFLYITDRKKDLLKTSGGKFIAPQPIENTLKTDPLIAQAVVIGDKRKFASVVIAPNFPALEDWARAHRIAFRDRTDLIAQPLVQQLYHSIVDGVNRNLAQFEKLKRLLIVPDEFTIASGEVTPTLKLRRRVIEQKYREQIEALYAEHADSVPERVATG
jgi:long-chain acyl-CoA synthetase